MQIGAANSGNGYNLHILKFKMADGRHIENWKFAIFSWPFSRLRQNFAWICRLWLETVQKVKIRILPKFNMADGRHIGNLKLAISLQPFIRSRRNFACTCRLGRKQRERLKFAYFKNSTYLKSKIRNISAIVQPIATKFCINMQIVAVKSRNVTICLF